MTLMLMMTTMASLMMRTKMMMVMALMMKMILRVHEIEVCVCGFMREFCI